MKKLLKIFKIVIINFILYQPLIAQENFKVNEIINKKDTINFISLSNNYKEKKATILFIQGSKSIPIILTKDGIRKINLPFEYIKYLNKFNFIIINRKGTPLSSEYEQINKIITNPSSEYLKNDNLLYREKQTRDVINFLKKQDWVDRKKIYVVGHSEGYRVAAKASENNNSIKKLVCISADPFNRTSEDIVKLQIENLEINNDSINTKIILNKVSDFKSIGTVRNYKNDIELYNWASYEKFTPIKCLLNYNNPLMVVYGSNDYKSFNNYLLPFILKKDKLELKIYPDLDHNFFKKEFDKDGKPLQDSYHWDEVFKDIVDWLLNEKISILQTTRL